MFDPSAREVHLRGVAYNNMKQYEKALADFRKAIALDPQNLEIRYQQAVLFLAGGDVGAYRKVCVEMLERFGETEDPLTARPETGLAQLPVEIDPGRPD